MNGDFALTVLGCAFVFASIAQSMREMRGLPMWHVRMWFIIGTVLISFGVSGFVWPRTWVVYGLEFLALLLIGCWFLYIGYREAMAKGSRDDGSQNG